MVPPLHLQSVQRNGVVLMPVSCEPQYYSESDLKWMDRAFKMAMLREIKAGRESAPIGTYKAREEISWPTTIFKSYDARSIFGSAAQMCADAP